MKNSRSYSSKYHLKKEMEIIIEKLYDIKRTFQLYKRLLSGDSHTTLCKNFPYMFSIIIKAMEEKFVLGLYKVVYDKGDNGKNICVSDIIDIYNKNKIYFTEKKYYYVKNIDSNKRIRRYLNPKEIDLCIIQINKDLNKTKGMKEFLRNFRRKNLAHLDKKYTFNKRIKYYKGKITYIDIERLIDDLLEDMNGLYNSIFGISYAFLYNELDELEYLNNVVISNINRKTRC